MIAHIGRFVFALLALVPVAAGQVFDSPDSAKQDSDFAVQGEYVKATGGIQVIALGEGEFGIVIYRGGLPGAGWDGQPPQRTEGDADDVAEICEGYEKTERKSPTLGAKPPVGAVVLFDGSAESLRKHWKPKARRTTDGLLMEGATSIDTFHDFRIHLEFRTPFMPTARGQKRGNSGLYYQGRYETQILDSFGLTGESNEAGGLYSIRKPDLNMCLPPLSWQTYDAVFTAARYKDKKKISNARLTVRLNGVVIHNNVEVPNSTRAAPVKEAETPGPIFLQNHGNPVRFRNVWVLPIDAQKEARRPIIPAFERFHADGSQATNGGRLLASELNCVACHRASQIHDARSAPVLTKAGSRLQADYVYRFLQAPHVVKPGTTMPEMLHGLPAEERATAAAALTSYLLFDGRLKSEKLNRKWAQNGSRLYHEVGCVACHHRMDTESPPAATSVPLVAVGQKYSRTSLQQFLSNPHTVRRSGRMPGIDLSKDEIRDLAHFLTADAEDIITTPNTQYALYHQSLKDILELDQHQPVSEGVCSGLDLSVSQRRDGFCIRFTGYLNITKAGTYQFDLGSDDGSVLLIDGQQVVLVNGVHPHQFQSGQIKLQRGVHELQVDYAEVGGQESLELFVQGPNLSRTSIDALITLNSDGSPSKSKQTSSHSPNADAAAHDPSAPFEVDPELIATGRDLFSRFHCVQCHQKEGAQSSSMPIPAFADCRPGQGCLSSQPANAVPNYELNDAQMTALETQLTDHSNILSAAETLQVTMSAYNCYACHRRDQLGGPESNRNASFVSAIPEMGDEGRIPPPLDGVGDKLKPAWLRQVLTKGARNRPYMKTRMPKFGSGTEHLVNVFVGLDRQHSQVDVQLSEADHRIAAAGRKLVGSDGLSCIKCHTFGKYKASGIQAIDLQQMAKRINEDWFHRYLPKPEALRPGTRMPTAFPNGMSVAKEVYAGNPSKQIAAIWKYLTAAEKAQVPVGVIGGMIELKPQDRPIIYRNFIEGLTPRAIAVGHPEGAHFAWDADRMSLALIWHGQFLDAAKHWQGRGQGNQVPLGDHILKWDRGPAVAELSTSQKAWPTNTDGTHQFLGYRLDPQGRPTFRYTITAAESSVEIAESIIAQEHKPDAQLVRHIRIVKGSSENIYFRAAVGKSIVPQQGGYLIDNAVKLELNPNHQTIVRNINDQKELLVRLPNSATTPSRPSSDAANSVHATLSW